MQLKHFIENAIKIFYWKCKLKNILLEIEGKYKKQTCPNLMLKCV